MRSLMTTLGRATGIVVAVVAFGAFGSTGARASSPPSCKLVSPKEIKAVLGYEVPKPIVTRRRTVTVCQYEGPAKTATVRFETDESRKTLKRDRAGFESEGEKTKTFTGLGLPAFSSVIPGFQIYTLVVLKGHTTVLVTADAPLAKVAKLVKMILPKI